MHSEVIRRLLPLLSERRIALMEEVIARRLTGVAVLLESLYDHGNLAAVMRTCEALGVLRVHWVDLPDTYKEARKVSQGAQKWLDVREHADVGSAVGWFRERGYRLAAADLDATMSLEELDVSAPVALVFGNEREGISASMRAACDVTYRIPMVGFAQSLNISCAAAISLYETVRRYRERLGATGDLSVEEAAEVRELFYRRAVKRSELLL
jgi:tRNA (guanosine-2'-O-)-methyltransferase